MTRQMLRRATARAHVCVTADQGFERVNGRVHAEFGLRCGSHAHIMFVPECHGCKLQNVACCFAVTHSLAAGEHALRTLAIRKMD